MTKWIYTLFVQCYGLAAHLVAPFNKKAKKWIAGRKNLFTEISRQLERIDGKRIWIHCSSLGEFEQGRPLIEALRQEYPRCRIILTFFSPSGYEPEKNYRGADHVFYMPVDSPRNARRFFDLLHPSLVIFVKYEYWYYHLKEAKTRNIPLLLISGIFRENQPFFRWYGSLHREMLTFFTLFFVQNQQSLALLQSIGLRNVSVTGDTRFDRVHDVAENFRPVNFIDHFCGDKKVIVAGSTWLEDDEELDHYANTHPEIRFIIAPHDIGESRLLECEKLYHHTIRYSHYLSREGHAGEEGINTLIIDNIGLLKYLYRYADICYVGGGFGGDGVHNVLEAAVYGKPVVFGPVYDKYPEATELLDTGGGFTVLDAIELETCLDLLLSDNEVYQKAAVAAREFVLAGTGATGKVMQFIYKNLRLTS